jgi:hypothetical protein
MPPPRRPREEPRGCYFVLLVEATTCSVCDVPMRAGTLAASDGTVFWHRRDCARIPTRSGVFG